MNEKKRFLQLLTIVIFLGLFINGYAQQSNPDIPQPMNPPLGIEQSFPAVEKVSPGIFRIGDIQINKNNKSITFPAVVNMDKGLLEYILVRSGGKTHESLLRTKAEPYHIQIAFLLLGFEGTSQSITGQGSLEKPKGEAVEITFSYNKERGKDIKINPEEWVVKRIGETFKGAEKLDWVFTGSLIIDGRFLAQIEGSIIAIYRDPLSLIDNASPGGESDEIWFVKEGAIPPVGTPVTVTIKAKK